MFLINKSFIELLDLLRIILQVLTLIISLLYFKKLKKTIWKWFVIYLCIIVFFEFIFKFKNEFIFINKSKYYEVLIIPLQFLFFYWLYTIKYKNIFYITSSIYLVSLCLDLFVFEENKKIVYSFSYCIGTFLLFLIIIREFISFFKSEEIIYFKSNKMFYINFGNLIFYVGTLPYIVFYNYLKFNHNGIYIIYVYYFKFSICIMYIFYIASFLWGKPKKY